MRAVGGVRGEGGVMLMCVCEQIDGPGAALGC